jgi:hypothetical protein
MSLGPRRQIWTGLLVLDVTSKTSIKSVKRAIRLTFQGQFIGFWTRPTERQKYQITRRPRINDFQWFIILDLVGYNSLWNIFQINIGFETIWLNLRW